MRRLAPVLVLFLCLSVQAATCPATITICAAFEEAPLIFRGRVIATIQHASPMHEFTRPDGSTVRTYESVMTEDFRFEVVEAFKGTPDREIIISGANGQFEEGKEYIVFATFNPETGTVQTSICLPNHLVEDPDQDSDLAWLRAYPTAPPTANIFGKVAMSYGVTEIPSIKVTLAGSESRTTFSGEDHSYSFNGLPPGTYTLTAILPAGYVNLEKDSVGVTLAAKGCVEVDWAIRHDTHIKGTVADAGGSPVSGARIGLLRPAENRTGFDIVSYERTDVDGNYDFSKVQPGDYWVALYYLGPFNDEPHAPVFYPSGANSSSAKLIHVDPSASIENINLVSTPVLRRVSSHVHVVNPDGTPVTKAHVIASDPLSPINALSATADENGDADIILYEGREYRLIASASGDREPACAGPITFIAKDGLQLGTLKLDKTFEQCRTLQKAK
ncbi:MAG TPA: carboxypeptidase regulatory-like domain-containing protein [Candidatus Acidoferrales bacterium]|nr:carboxypeptidase regulatory-like domain-containing protein [Candidatus Acidoferrales bacterium]